MDSVRFSIIVSVIVALKFMFIPQRKTAQLFLLTGKQFAMGQK